MSWIGGSFVIKDASKKELERAKAIVTSHVRHNADLEEFPNMGCSLPFKVKNDKVFDSFDAAEEFSDKIFAQWNRKYHLVVPFKDTSEAKETKKVQDLQVICAFEDFEENGETNIIVEKSSNVGYQMIAFIDTTNSTEFCFSIDEENIIQDVWMR